MITPRLLAPLVVCLLLPHQSPAAVPDLSIPLIGPHPYFPFAGITDRPALLSRLMRGGCWLAGLPGLPRYNGTHVHAGVDFRAALGEPILAVIDGVVDPASDVPHAGYGPGWTRGRCLIVRSESSKSAAISGGADDSRPLLIIYGHTQNHRVAGGQAVRAGDILAEVGPWLDSEGGPHLHLTLRLGELPRYGWGTPTLAGNTLREGAEAVASEADVLALGYRNPLLLWPDS